MLIEVCGFVGVLGMLGRNMAGVGGVWAGPGGSGDRGIARLVVAAPESAELDAPSPAGQRVRLSGWLRGPLQPSSAVPTGPGPGPVSRVP
jgi:hypothetical protein